MNVLHVYRTYFPTTQGGLEEVIRQICANTQHHGVTSRVLSLASTPPATPLVREEATVYIEKKHLEVSSCSISLSALRTFRELVDWADIVQYHFPWPFADVLHLLGHVTKPCILTYHSDIVRQRFLSFFYTPLMNRFLAAMDRIVCTSPNYFATSPVLSRFEDKVEVIPIGLDSSAYFAEGRELQSDRVETIGPPYFLFIGVLRYYKGLHILLEAMKGAPYRVVIVGSGPTERSLKEQASSLALDNVVFAGHISDGEKISLLKNARAIVFPSYLRSEAFGVTLLEGAMFSRPLISTEVGSGTSHVNIHQETGLVVAPGSAKALRRAMDRLYEDEALARRMGEAANRRYQALFTGKLMGERYFSLYQDVLGHSDATDQSVAASNHRRR